MVAVRPDRSVVPEFRALRVRGEELFKMSRVAGLEL